MRFIHKLLCLIDWHGPDVMGYGSCLRSGRTEGFVRECFYCGAVWHGEQVYYKHHRSVGNWRRVK